MTNAKSRARWITIEGASTNNLNHVSLQIPKHQLTVLTGVSGSGKSSLAFDTIAAAAQQLVAETYPSFIRNRMPQGSSVIADKIDGLTFTTVVDQRSLGSNARSTVGTASDIAPLIRLLFSRISHPSAGFSPAYSFNHPDGMCPTCEGLGVTNEISIDALLDWNVSLRDGAIRFPSFAPGTYRWKRMVLSGLVDPDVPLRDAPHEAVDQLLHAKGITLTNPDPGYVKSRKFDGVLPRIRDSYLRKSRKTSEEERAALERVVTRTTCPDCAGTRLNPAARASRINGKSITDWMSLPLADLAKEVENLDCAEVAPLITAIKERLDAATSVGLGYLSLDRESGTLSGGEAQRIKVIRYLGSGLSDVCYVFDEPSAGLHPHDVHRLLRLLKRLRDTHNTVIVVEHHQAVINAADHVVDLGPGAGIHGGTIVFQGSPRDLLHADSPTGKAMRRPLQVRHNGRQATATIRIIHASTHNLQDVSVDVPLGVFTVVSGVAGSGKSSLFSKELPRQHRDFTVLDQAPLRGGSRSNPATFLGVADPLRIAFSAATGLEPSWFIPNGKGACPQCKGRGVVITDLAFLDDVRTVCEACKGTRFNPTALEARLGSHNIADILGMSAAQTMAALSDHPAITARLTSLGDVGLDYLPIGQSTSTLSGGERQRLQLARTLIDIDDARNLRIVLDEPTSGLHGHDVARLLTLFDRLVDAGATVIAIEHDLQTICHADHVIDIGPGAGGEGGRVVYAGPPQGLLDCNESLTGQYLRRATSTSSRWNSAEEER